MGTRKLAGSFNWHSHSSLSLFRLVFLNIYFLLLSSSSSSASFWFSLCFDFGKNTLVLCWLIARNALGENLSVVRDWSSIQTVFHLIIKMKKIFMKHITKQRYYEITKLPNTTMLNFITMQANFDTMDGYNASIDWLIDWLKCNQTCFEAFTKKKKKKHHKQLFLRSQSVDIYLFYIYSSCLTLLTLHKYIYIYNTIHIYTYALVFCIT